MVGVCPLFMGVPGALFVGVERADAFLASLCVDFLEGDGLDGTGIFDPPVSIDFNLPTE